MPVGRTAGFLSDLVAIFLRQAPKNKNVIQLIIIRNLQFVSKKENLCDHFLSNNTNN